MSISGHLHAARVVKPIYGTDLAKKPSVLIEELRQEIVKIRGKLDDIQHAHPVWKDRIVSVEGLLTCGLVSLHITREEMIRHELLFPSS